MSGVPTS